MIKRIQEREDIKKMAKQYYLDAEGLQRLIDFLRLQFYPVKQQSENNAEAIEVLNKPDGSPGSIQTLISQAISNLDIADLKQDELLRIYCGSASDLIEEVNNNENG